MSAPGRGGSSSTVHFLDESGIPRQIEANFLGTIGETVHVGHPAGRPQHARRIGGVTPWAFPVMATAVGGVFLWVAASLLTSGLPRVLTGH